MSQPAPILLLSDSDDDEEKLCTKTSETPNIDIDLTTPISNKKKSRKYVVNLDDDPTPPPPSKHQKSVDDSLLTSFTAIPLSDSALIPSGDSMERSPECAMKDKQFENKELVPNIDFESWLDIDSTFCLHKVVESNIHGESGGLGNRSSMKNRTLPDLYVEQKLEERPEKLKGNCQENDRITATFYAESLEKYSSVQSTCQHGNLKSAKTHDRTYMEDDTVQILPIEDHDHEKENARLEKGGATSKPKRGVGANAEKIQNKDNQAENRKKVMEQKKLMKEQEKLRKAELKAEAAKQKLLEKERKKWEKHKFSEKDIEAEIDPKVLSGPLGGPLLTTFNQKGLRSKITPNFFEKSIVWRMILPEDIFQHSTVKTEIRYILLIYDDAEEFCNRANDGSLMDHISSVRKHYQSYTICCLTNRLMSFINKREQQKYKKQKVAIDWVRPPVEELFAKLATQFSSVHSRQCVDEAEVAEHVVGLTVNLAKCHSRKKLTHLSVNANGCNVTKDCVDRSLIMKHPWLKALVAIPKVQPRFAIAIWKKYPTMKSLLRVYMDPTKTVHEKELLLEDLPLEGITGNETRLGDKCSKRMYRILMTQNGSIKTDDVVNGAGYFSSQSP